MKKVTILDTSIATKNVGDEIIVDSVNREIFSVFKDKAMFYKIPTHEVVSRHSRRIINESNYSFVAGTNLLTSKYRLFKANSWNINFMDAINFSRVILIGVGWGGYQKNPNLLSKMIYKSALDSELIHSVRDNYTKEKLKSIGITNVVNTACATMWQLTHDHCRQIPTKKGTNVVMTITDYRKDIKKDKELIRILERNYENIYIWIQGSNDAEYLTALSDSVKIISPTLQAFDYLLESDIDLDYIGTRLHAGIRAMQKKRRSIIIGVDNRALEKQRDFNINVIDRNEIDKLEDYINSEIKTEIKLDFEEIDKWKSQFIN